MKTTDASPFALYTSLSLFRILSASLQSSYFAICAYVVFFPLSLFVASTRRPFRLFKLVLRQLVCSLFISLSSFLSSVLLILFLQTLYSLSASLTSRLEGALCHNCNTKDRERKKMNSSFSSSSFSEHICISRVVVGRPRSSHQVDLFGRRSNGSGSIQIHFIFE